VNPPDGGMTDHSPLGRPGSQATGCSVAAIVLFAYPKIWAGLRNFFSSLLGV